MPDLVGMTLKSVAAQKWVGTLDSDQIQVSFPATVAVWGSPPHRHSETFPATDLPLHELDGSIITVLGQSPSAGNRISTSTTVSLRVAPHSIESGKPWITTGHPAAINRDGAAACLEGPGGGCHTEMYCPLCHSNDGSLPPGSPPL